MTVLSKSSVRTPDKGSQASGPPRRGAAALRRLIGAVLGWVLLLAAWQLVAVSTTSFNMPTPLDVAAEMVQIVVSGEFVENFFWTVAKTAVGFFVALVLGVLIGYLMGRYTFWNAYFQDLMTLSVAMPTLIYAVLALMIFGLSSGGPVLAVTLVSLPFIALNVAEGVRGIDQNLLKMAKAYGVPNSRVRRHIVAPALVPFIFIGIRLAFAVAWKVSALTEVFGGNNGIGFEIKREYTSFSIVGIMAWMFLFVIFMVALERLLLARLERRLLSWRPEERNTL